MPKSPPDQSTPTIRTVAKHAGVAVSTVSRVINGGSASKLTQERVQKSIAELRFSPTPAAQGLATRRASTMGLVVNSTRGSWFSELIAGVEEALGHSRRSVLIASLRLTGSYNQSVVSSWIQEKRVDGLIFIRCSDRERPLLRAAAKANIPVALIAPDVASRAEVVVRCRNIDGGVAVTSHLIDLGHERIAFVGGPEGSRDTIERLQGVKQELQRRGLKLPSSSVWFGINYYSEMGAEYAKRFSKKNPEKRPTAVIFANDAMALGFSKAVLTHGLRIPEDVSIAGFDDSPEAALVWPGLTTVAQPSRRMAAGACHALLKRIDRDAPSRAESFTYDVELVVRESCAPPGGSRPNKSR